MRSMFSGVSGLRVHQTKMDVIANNIANVNTVGFKSSRTLFSEIFSQTISGASRGNETTGRGGVNPQQIGLGATVAAIDLQMTQGAAQRTDGAYDVMINGDGFFIVGDNSGQYFTRAGAFNLDESGNLVNSSGMCVYGWDRVWNSETAEYDIQKGAVKPITITGDKRYAPPATTTLTKVAGNLNADTNPVHPNTMTFYDSLGNRYVANIVWEYQKDASTVEQSVWTWRVDTQTVEGKEVTQIFMDTDMKKPIDFEIKPESLGGAVVFNNNGKIDGIANATFTKDADGNVDATVDLGSIKKGVTKLDINFKAKEALTPAAVFGKDGKGDITFDFTDITQFGTTASAKFSSADGNYAGTLQNVSIGTSGEIMGRYSNGDLVLLGQIPVARFRNPAGMEKFGDNLYVPTANSGEWDGIGEDATAGGGSLRAGTLEMSNVDLSNEFTEMITTQRGFQANSRVITVSDDMLQELVNLKR